MEPTAETATARGEWKRGWPLVLASCSGMMLAPLVAFTMGLFLVPLESEFGWSRTIISSGLTIYAVISVIAAGFIGALIDRFGPRRVAIPGIAIYCLGIGLLGTVGSSPYHWWALWGFLTLGAILVKPTVWSAAVNSRFDKARGVALSFALCGTGLTAIFAPLVGGALLNEFGWRWAYAGIGAVWFALSMPLVLLFFYGASDLDRKKLGAKKAVPAEMLAGTGFKEAMRSAAFYKIALGSFLVMMIVTGGVVHFIPMLTERGFDRTTAVSLASAIGFATFAGRLVTGWLLDHLPPHWVGGVAFAMPGIACLAIVTLDGSTAQALICALLLGTSAGAEVEVASYLSSRYFGMRNFGTLFGLIGGLISLATGVGPAITAMTFDQLGSYELALWIGAPLALLSGLLIASLGNYRRFTAEPPTADPLEAGVARAS